MAAREVRKGRDRRPDGRGREDPRGPDAEQSRGRALLGRERRESRTTLNACGRAGAPKLRLLGNLARRRLSRNRQTEPFDVLN